MNHRGPATIQLPAHGRGEIPAMRTHLLRRCAVAQECGDTARAVAVEDMRETSIFERVDGGYVDKHHGMRTRNASYGFDMALL